MLRVKLNSNPVKVERYILVRKVGGAIEISPSNSVYLLVPAEIRNNLKNFFGVDLRRKDLTIECILAAEDESGKSEPSRVRLIYEFIKPER